jgi:4-amino-4-deoxy-L-arabinose transferase-like glycosyltransferase
MIKKHIKDNKYIYLIILIIIVYFTLTNIFWLKANNIPTAWDDSWNLLTSNYYYKTLVGQEHRSINQFGSNFPIFIHSITSYPPFFKISSLPLYFILGFSPKIAVLTNVFFYLIMIVSIFYITNKIEEKNSSIIAIFTVSTMPLLVGLSRIYLLDFAFASIVTAGLALLIKTNNFNSKKASILFGIIFGVGTLTKIHYPVLIIPTIIFYIFINKKEFKIKQFKNLILSGVISGIIILPWLFTDFKGILRYLLTYSSKSWALSEGDPQWTSIQGAFYYLRETWNGISGIYFMLFILAIILISIKVYKNKAFFEEKNKLIYLLTFFIVSTTIIFTYMANKDPRFIIPIFPAIAIISAIGITQSKLKNIFKILFILLVAIIILIPLNSYTFNYSNLEKDYDFNTKLGYLQIFPTNNPYLYKPLNQDWKIKEVIETIQKDNSSIKQKSIGIYSDNRFFNYINIQFYSYSYNANFDYINLGSEEYNSYNYIILKDNGDIGKVNKEIIKKIMNDKKYRKIKKFQLPDGSNAIIYKKSN